MVKLMIVDDEISIRKGLRKYVTWDAWGVELAAEAENAETALRIAPQVRPDILLTDIRMGEMDGIELARRMKEMFPSIRLIILSGYSDVKYLQAALHMKAAEYLLKPAGADKIIDAVVRAKDEILEEQKKWDESRQKAAFFDEHLPIIQLHFLDELTKGTEKNSESVTNKAMMLGLPTGGEYYICIMMDARRVLEDDGYKSGKEMDMCFWQFTQNVNEILRNYQGVFWCETGDLQFLFLINAETRDEVESKEVKLSEALTGRLSEIYMQKVYIGIGPPVSGLIRIGESRSMAERAVLSSAWEVQTQIYRAVSCNLEETEVCRKRQREILREIIAKEFEKAFSDFRGLYQEYRKIQIDFEEVKSFCQQICRLIPQVKARPLQEEENIFMPRIEGFRSADELEEWMDRFWRRHLERNEASYAEYSVLTQKTIQYVKEHYAEDITLQNLSKIVFVSPNYLGRIFFEDVGCRLGDWLNRYRVEKAKELLLKTDKKTYEIAEEVGFSGYKYFSVCFLKYAGCSARDYRNRADEISSI